MKKLIIFFVFTALITSRVLSQDFSRLSSKFGGGGGFIGVWIIPNVETLNEKLPSLGIDKLSKTGFFGTGGAGFISLWFVDNFRIGGIGFGGSTSESAMKDGFKNEIVYSYSGGGFTIEYILPTFQGAAIAVGAAIGAGEANVELFRNKDDYEWNNIWNNLSDPSINDQNSYHKLNSVFFSITPMLNVDIPLNRFVAFRIGGGYTLPIGGKWTIDNDRTIANVPSKFSKDAFYIQMGLFLGYFAF